ncbi:hypothetical protein QOZ80_3AG0247620 [Eleusine coracana subsp. coracana]|nr:hypothetical protein QOZ80_3AG0247620 [Eleusine coracana subsp. coracana]
MSSSSTQLESSGLDGDIRFDLYAALGAIAVAVVLAALFWRLYKLTVSARPQDMIPVVDPTAAAGDAKLRQRDVAALPVFVHRGGGEDAAVVECAVCLAEMEDGERGRLLPGCGHRFHVECIDRWFRAHSTCPLCRAAVVGREAPVEAHKGGAAPPQVVVVVQS